MDRNCFLPRDGTRYTEAHPSTPHKHVYMTLGDAFGDQCESLQSRSIPGRISLSWEDWTFKLDETELSNH